MNKYKHFMVVVAAILFLAPNLSANQSSRQPTRVVRQDTQTIYDGEYWMGEKLIRGLSNVVGAPLEIHRSVRNKMEKQGDIVGLAGGFFEGIGLTALRAVVGVIEVGTFPIPTPKNYRPVLAPEFIWPGTRQTPYTEVTEA